MTEVDATETFRQEAQELLEQLEQTLLDLEHTPNDSDLIDTAFRALHTIKGSGAMFGFDAVAGFTHHVETAFDLVRKGKVPPSPGLIAVALSAKDRMRVLIEHPETTDTTEGDAILRDLAAIVGGTPALPSTAAEPATEAGPQAVTWRINFRLATDAMAMGTNPLLLLDELRALGSATITAQTDAIPALEDLTPTDCRIGWSVVLISTHPRADLESVFMFVIDDMQLSIEAEDQPGESAATAPTPAAAVATAQAKPAKPAARAVKETTKVADRVRVPAERLDHLMEQVGELVIVQSRLSQVATNSTDMEVKAIAEDIERLTLALRDTTMGVRTLPIAALFGRFRRLVHDLSNELGKEIDLVTVGEETELDSTVIERLADPLTHLIRNSLDHGLETPEGRLAAGKPRRGKLTLTARHAGAEVHVSITDDGRGLDRARIRARAEENGLLAPGVVLSDNELFQVLFLPGFSTAATVTSLSGRGVGMDVVKRTIEDLRGKIDITSTFGAGTQMSLRLPLTLAIIDGLMVRVGTGRYVLPLSSVEECVELSVEDDARSRGRNFLNIRGDLVPYLRLREMFHAQVPADCYQKVVVVSAGDARVGLVVDQVIGNHQTVIKSLSRLHADVRIFSGATILGNGAVALIMDIAHLVELGVARDAELQAAE
jgi:two-component system chemotaxis sensor kinase CheA